jgi:isochorismate hydrolase
VRALLNLALCKPKFCNALACWALCDVKFNATFKKWDFLLSIKSAVKIEQLLITGIIAHYSVPSTYLHYKNSRRVIWVMLFLSFLKRA